MIEGAYHARESNLSVVMKFLTGRLKIKTKDTRIWSVIAVTIIALPLFWAGAALSTYLADDVSPRPADERSVPSPRSD